MIFVLLIVSMVTSVYCMMVASFAWEDIVFGLLLSGALLWIFRSVSGPRRIPANGVTLRVLAVLPRFVVMLMADVARGTWEIFSVVYGLRPLEHPGIVKVPLPKSSPQAIGITGLLMNISPGSFLVDIDWEREIMLFHVIDASEPEEVRRRLVRYFVLHDAAEGVVSGRQEREKRDA